VILEEDLEDLRIGVRFPATWATTLEIREPRSDKTDEHDFTGGTTVSLEEADVVDERVGVGGGEAGRDRVEGGDTGTEGNDGFRSEICGLNLKA
jgi:hypothetical protein